MSLTVERGGAHWQAQAQEELHGATGFVFLPRGDFLMSLRDRPGGQGEPQTPKAPGRQRQNAQLPSQNLPRHSPKLSGRLLAKLAGILARFARGRCRWAGWGPHWDQGFAPQGKALQPHWPQKWPIHDDCLTWLASLLGVRHIPSLKEQQAVQKRLH